MKDELMSKKMKNVGDLVNEITNAGLDICKTDAIKRLDTLTGKIRMNDETNEYDLSNADELACHSNINLIRLLRERDNT